MGAFGSRNRAPHTEGGMRPLDRLLDLSGRHYRRRTTVLAGVGVYQPGRPFAPGVKTPHTPASLSFMSPTAAKLSNKTRAPPGRATTGIRVTAGPGSSPSNHSLATVRHAATASASGTSAQQYKLAAWPRLAVPAPKIRRRASNSTKAARYSFFQRHPGRVRNRHAGQPIVAGKGIHRHRCRSHHTARAKADQRTVLERRLVVWSEERIHLQRHELTPGRCSRAQTSPCASVCWGSPGY